MAAIRQAVVIYPLIALLFTVPYLAVNYRRYGAVVPLRTAVVYSFVLYLLCAYCLVILPLPTGEKAEALRGHPAQWIPFSFLSDMAREAQFSWRVPRTWLKMLTTPAFISALSNVVMLLPFGVYLRYYYRCGRGKTVALAFALSLFFELTQLSGLYFLYPGSYRLFDVDDLMTNTLGGLAGYALAPVLTRFLPDREALDKISLEKARRVSLLRRTVALCYDLGIALAAFVPLYFLFRPLRHFSLVLGAYILLCLLPGRGRTLGLKWTRLRLADKNGGTPPWYRCAARYALLFGGVFYLPWRLLLRSTGVCTAMGLDESATLTVFCMLGCLYVLFLLAEGMLALLHRPLWYERLSGAYLTGADGTAVPENTEKKTEIAN